MSRYSILVEDNFISIDGVPYEVDCSSLLQQKIRVVQWYGAEGEVEFLKHAQPNQKIDSITPFQEIIDKAVSVKNRVYQCETWDANGQVSVKDLDARLKEMTAKGLEKPNGISDQSNGS